MGILLKDPGLPPSKEERRRFREIQAWRMENLVVQIAEKAEREETQLAAALKMHAICEGTPVQTTRITGSEGGPIQTIDVADPIEAARLYQEFMGKPTTS